MFKGHPKGLYALALANTGERFGYYTMLAIFVLFLQAKFGYNEAQAATSTASSSDASISCPSSVVCWPTASVTARW